MPDEQQSWARMSVYLATFGFINLILFIVLSSPMGMVFDMIDEQSERLDVQADTVDFIDMFRTIFGLMFVFSMVGLILWFFLGAHREEYEQY